MKHILENILLRTFALIVGAFPFRLVSWAGSFFGRIAYLVIPLRKKVVMINLSTAFPELSNAEHEALCKSTYIKWGRTFFEYVKMYNFTLKKAEKMLEFENKELFYSILSQESGWMGLSAHFGNFELIVVAVSLITGRTDIMVKEMKNKKVENFLFANRLKTGSKIIYMKEGIAPMIESLSLNRILLLASDQDGGKDGEFVDFFGVSSSVPSGAALLAIRKKCPIYVLLCARLQGGKFKVYIEELKHAEFAGGIKEKKKMIMQEYNSILEKYVRKYPDQYFWHHKKWKSSGIKY